MDIKSVVTQGTYKTLHQFNKNQKNFEALVKYCQKLQPQEASFVNASGLIRFYRLPIIIAFRNLYDKFKTVVPQAISPELKTVLLDIAAWVNSLLQKLQIQVFGELQFIFHWGKAKKKYNIQVSPLEIKFGKHIFGLSKKREKIKEKLQRELEVQEDLKELETEVISENLNYFQQNFINFIKQTVALEVNQQIIQAQKKLKKEMKQISSPKKQEQPAVKKIKTNQRKSEKQIKSPQKMIVESESKKIEQLPKSQFKQKKTQLFSEQLPYQQEKKFPMCCRTYFLQDQVIQQAQNEMIEYKHYKWPFNDQPNQRLTKLEKIKRTLCGFLNNIGGTIYFGIKEHPDTKKRQIYGYQMPEISKSYFENDIFDLLKDIIPDVQKNCVVKWVPIKNKNKNQFVPGRFVAKVIIQKGAKDQLYSYIHDRTQKFVFKTQNEFLVVPQAQKILKIFRNKLENPERSVYVLHQNPCREPLIGKPVYKEHQVSKDVLQQQFPSIMERNSRYQTAAEKKYKQKDSTFYLIRGFKMKQLETELDKQKVDYKIQEKIQLKDIIVNLPNQNDVFLLKKAGIQLYQIYSTIKFQITSKQEQMISDIKAQIAKEQKCQIFDKLTNILKFQTAISAAKFWLKVIQMGITIHFIPQGTWKS